MFCAEDTETRKQESVGADYLRYMDEVFAFDEKVSRDLLGREVRQVLLLHANALNADLFGRLADALQGRGYRFITLEEALKDEAYRRPDTYVGPWGFSWLHHWEVTEGRKRSPSPDPPDWSALEPTPSPPGGDEADAELDYTPDVGMSRTWPTCPGPDA